MFGDKIRELRKEKGLTLAEVAEKVDVTTGHISQIERNMMEPSLAVLRKIANVLDTSLSMLLSEEAATDVVVVPKHKRVKVKFGDINIQYEFLTPLFENIRKNPNFEVIYFTLAPKSWGSNDMMIHKADECVYVLEGELEYHIGDNVYNIGTGGTIYVPENYGHHLYNNGDKEVVAIGVISPPVY